MEGRYYRRQPGSGFIPGRLKSRGFIIGTAIVLPFLFYILFGSHGIVQRIQLESRIGDLHRKIEDAQLENERLKSMAKSLDSDLKAIEKVAREKYGMMREGETVYRVRGADVGARDPEEARTTERERNAPAPLNADEPSDGSGGEQE
jgi:cell division protein FtsB